MWMMLVFTVNSLLNFVVSLLVAKFLGPAEYGRFVLALSASVVIQLLLFDWLRFAATRFYSERDRLQRPNVRATLDAAFGWIAFAASLAAFGVYASGLDLPLSPDLAGLAIGVSISNGLFDFACALLRARFLDKSYGLLVVAKNALAFTLTVGGAFWFGSTRRAMGAPSVRWECDFWLTACRSLAPTFSISPFRCLIVFWSRSRSASPKPDNIRSPMRSASALSARLVRR
jgi:hypothetical protein